MIELPEALTIAGQLNAAIRGKRVAAVAAGHTPHKLAWYYGETQAYPGLLMGKTVGEASALGSMVEIHVEEATVLLGEGVSIRFHSPGETHPAKHQFLIEFDDRSALSAAVQMYGGMGAFPGNQLDNKYYKLAKERVSPSSPAFDRDYFARIASAPEVQKLSLKGLLATEQRIPGLGNGVLQDILFNARMHPKKKINTLSENAMTDVFNAVRVTLAAMAAGGGRDTEMDLFGKSGGYRTLMSKNTVNKPCPVCGTIIKKEAYMGGSVYYCESCQEV